MGKKKFFDKKKSATFHLLARDSSDPNYDPEGPSGDRVFIRVDNNHQYAPPGFGDDQEEPYNSADDYNNDPDSIFADADEDDEVKPKPKPKPASSSSGLPDNIRREILELGLPDDGYNYLLHLREIKKSGGGSAYYENSKAKLDQISHDVKAYDASRVHVSRAIDADDLNDTSIYSVAARTFGVKVQKVIDPEVTALLDDTDLSRFGSEVEEDLEEDFVVRANVADDEEDEEVDVVADEIVKLRLNNKQPVEFASDGFDGDSECVEEKPRVRRLLDEQFDLLTLQEYGSESDDDHGGSMEAEDECLADKLNDVLHHVKDDLELDDKYRVPADLLHSNGMPGNSEIVETAAAVIRRCAEYGEQYDNENPDKDDVVILEESSDERELWDCETIVSTYSNLDNHPGKIQAPEGVRRKRLAEAIPAVPEIGKNVITLRGKNKLPVDYLPHRSIPELDRAKETPDTVSNLQKKRVGEESKEEKKERKTAVKEERREARKAKKELRGIYRCEAQRAQKVAAVSGPSAIHLM